MPGAFDRVLLDVPCSGEGRFIVGAPGTSRAWSRKLIADRARLQRKLFESGFHAVRPGGVLVYSTCTLNLEENEKVIHWALESFALEGALPSVSSTVVTSNPSIAACKALMGSIW